MRNAGMGAAEGSDRSHPSYLAAAAWKALQHRTNVGAQGPSRVHSRGVTTHSEGYSLDWRPAEVRPMGREGGSGEPYQLAPPGMFSRVFESMRLNLARAALMQEPLERL